VNNVMSLINLKKVLNDKNEILPFYFVS